MKAWRDDGKGSNLESGTLCCNTGRPFSEDATLQLPDPSCKVDMMRFIQKRPRPISLQRGLCLDRSPPATGRREEKWKRC